MKAHLLALLPLLGSCTAQALAPDELHVFRTWGELDANGCGGYPLALDGEDQDFDSLGVGLTWHLGQEDDRGARALERLAALMEARNHGLELEVPVRVNVRPEATLEVPTPKACELEAVPAPGAPPAPLEEEAPVQAAAPTLERGALEDLEGELMSLVVAMVLAVLTYLGRERIPGVRQATHWNRARRARRAPPG